VLTPDEQVRLNEECSRVPMTENTYIAMDFVSTLLDTVIDYQQHTTTVRNAIRHFNENRWDDVRSMADLKSVLAGFSDDRAGDTDLALHLWGYKFWRRARELRGLVAFVDGLGIDSIEQLRLWAERSTFRDFEGKVKGLGPVVYQWLVMRLGVETVKPDVHIMRFVERAVGRKISESEAVSGLVAAAQYIECKANELDWSIWEYERSGE
jgi:hypothetical protein